MTIFPQRSSQPFYFASVHSMWIYELVPPENVRAFLQNSGAEAALFDGQAMAMLNFQRFTDRRLPPLGARRQSGRGQRRRADVLRADVSDDVHLRRPRPERSGADDLGRHLQRPE